MFQLGLFLRALRPARTGLRPARFTRALPEINLKKKINFVLFLQNVIAVFVFSDSQCKNACKMLADLCPCFHQSPTRPNFGRSRVKVCPILCRLRTKLCPNFGCTRARLCPISFAPCPFANLAGTLYCDNLTSMTSRLETTAATYRASQVYKFGAQSGGQRIPAGQLSLETRIELHQLSVHLSHLVADNRTTRLSESGDTY